MITSTRQLTQTTIHADDFHDNAYSFPIYSVLTTESAPGKLVITTSEGYLLTTSSASQPKREQNLAYKQQADGRWAVHSVITIMPGEQGFPDGLVRIQNTQTGITVLTIQGESTALARVPIPSFAVSETALSFGQTAPSQPKSLIFSISQQYADELLTITSDAPEYFLLATDSHPNFTASLSVKPSPIGTYVHVRYLTKKSGTHSGQLLVQSAFDEQTIALTGRTARLLPTIRMDRPLNGYAQPEQRSSAMWLKIGAVIASLLIVISLAWFGFFHRQIPSASTNASEPTRQSAASEKAISTRPIVVANKPVEKAASLSVRSESDPKEKHSEPQVMVLKKAASKPVGIGQVDDREAKTEVRTIEQRPKERKESVTKPTESLVTKQPYRQARPVQATGESELEKELNQLTPNQPE